MSIGVVALHCRFLVYEAFGESRCFRQPIPGPVSVIRTTRGVNMLNTFKIFRRNKKIVTLPQACPCILSFSGATPGPKFYSLSYDGSFSEIFLRLSLRATLLARDSPQPIGFSFLLPSTVTLQLNPSVIMCKTKVEVMCCQLQLKYD